MRNSEELSLMDIILLIKKNLFKILASAVICAVVTGLFTAFFVEPKYTASMKWVVINKSRNETMTISDVQMSTLLIGDCIEIIKSRDLMESIIKSRAIQDLTAKELADNIEVKSPTGTRTIDITVSDANGIRAKRIADELFTKGAPLIKEKLDVKQVDIIESPIKPTSPSSPNVQRNTILGGVAGALLVVIVLLVSKLTNNKLSSIDDIEAELGVTVLASIPKSGVQSRKRAHRRALLRDAEHGSHGSKEV